MLTLDEQYTFIKEIYLYSVLYAEHNHLNRSSVLTYSFKKLFTNYPETENIFLPFTKKFKLKELKFHLKNRNLPVSGNKEDLICRLNTHNSKFLQEFDIKILSKYDLSK